MKLFHWLLLMLLIPGLKLYSQTAPPEKRGVMVVRKQQTAQFTKSEARDRLSVNNVFNNNDVKSMPKRDPRYKGEPYVGNAEEVNVSIMDSNKKGFQYKYMDNALLLYGAFNTRQYELYEVKSSISQKLYMYFEKKWFELKQNSKKAPLEEIDNPTLVNYLNKQFLAK